jgi:uncharacterized repeat protein (TIGR03847 family)
MQILFRDKVMPRIEMELHPVDDITTDAIGEPGERAFYIQASKDDQVITLLVEKIQIQSLAVAVEQFLAEIKQENPEIPDASSQYNEEEMHLKFPVDPLFRVGNFGLGYDSSEDLVILVLREAGVAGEEAETAAVIRLWCTRSQLRCMVHWGIELGNRGRSVCPLCGEVINPDGHFCPKNNGHKKSREINDEQAGNS